MAKLLINSHMMAKFTKLHSLSASRCPLAKHICSHTTFISGSSPPTAPRCLFSLLLWALHDEWMWCGANLSFPRVSRSSFCCSVWEPPQAPDPFPLSLKSKIQLMFGNPFTQTIHAHFVATNLIDLNIELCVLKSILPPFCRQFYGLSQ